MILAADENEVRGNTSRGNNTTGLMVISYSEAFFEPADDPNGAASYLNFDLRGGGMNPSTDLTAVTCQHPELPG